MDDAGGIAGALLLAYLHARGVSRPLKKLAKDEASCGQRQLPASEPHGPKEASELVHAFNRMAEELEQLDQLKADLRPTSPMNCAPSHRDPGGHVLLLEDIWGP